MDGSDKKYFEIDASTIELIQSAGNTNPNVTVTNISENSLEQDNSIDDDEIPF